VIFLKDVPDGWWRQLCGANYYNAVVQFLQAEKKIRLRSLVSMGYGIKEIKLIFEDAKNKRSEQQKEEIESFVRDLEGFHFTDEGNIQESDQAILYYIAGYIAKYCLIKIVIFVAWFFLQEKSRKQSLPKREKLIPSKLRPKKSLMLLLAEGVLQNHPFSSSLLFMHQNCLNSSRKMSN